MNVELKIQLGLYGDQQLLRPIYLDVGSVGAASSWSGSYHVLSMGRHYDDYVITGRTISLPPISGIPAAHPYERLSGKIRAAGVSGNIGEAIAAIFARRCLGAGIGDIAHIRPRIPFRRRKAPDYLMRLGGLMPGQFGGIIPNGSSFQWPVWWPVESKARTAMASSKAARNEALRQLVAYWALLVNSQPQVAGYGMIVVFTYKPPRELRVNLVLPNNQASLIRELRKAENEIDLRVIRSSLYGC
jgi:hypothetical protein